MPTRRSTLPALLAIAVCALAAVLLGGVATAAAATVTVAPGDTLGAIAARNGTTVAAIVAANGIADPNRIAAGRRLTIPAAGAASSGGAAASVGSYRVSPGDTLGSIAARHGTSVGALAALNGLADPNRIAAGAVIRVPAGGGRAGGPWAWRPSTPAAPRWAP